MHKKYHIFYFTIFLENNRFKGIYGGIHSTNYLNDEYIGSGKKIVELKESYTADCFLKFNMKFFNSRKELLEYEKKIINKDWIKNPYTLNIAEGGTGKLDEDSSIEKRINNISKKLEKELLIYNSYL